MPRYLVAIEGNTVVRVDALHDADDDELGLEWALSELRDTYRHAKLVNATFTLSDEAELKEFLGAVRKLLGADALGEHGDIG